MLLLFIIFYICKHNNNDISNFLTDTENPKVLTCPTSFEVRLEHGENGRMIVWQEPTFSDNVRIQEIYKSRVSTYINYWINFFLQIIQLNQSPILK